MLGVLIIAWVGIAVFISIVKFLARKSKEKRLQTQRDNNIAMQQKLYESMLLDKGVDMVGKPIPMMGTSLADSDKSQLEDVSKERMERVRFIAGCIGWSLLFGAVAFFLFMYFGSLFELISVLGIRDGISVFMDSFS